MFLRTTSSAFALIAFAFPALADVTPAEVWQNWVDYYKANGYTVTEGAREEAGETLSLKDVAVSFAAPDDQGAVSFTLPEVTLTGTGDGKVRTTFAETSPFKVEFKDAEGDLIAMNGSVVMKDAEIVSSGSAADMTHDTTASELSGALTTIVVPDEGEKPFPLTVALTNVKSMQHMVDGDLIKVDANLSADKMTFDGTFEDNSGDMPGKIAFTGSIDAIKGSGQAAIPKGGDIADDINAGLKAGLAMGGTMSAGAGQFNFDYAGKDEAGTDQTAKGSGKFDGFDLTANMSANGLSYQGGSDASSFEMTASDLPFPFSYSVANTTFDLQMPVMKSDTPVPFKFAYSLGGLTIADGVWDLFDGAKVLPRDPASVDIDVTGLAKVTMDLFDPANMKAMEEAADAQTDTADAAVTDAPANADAAPAETDAAATDTAAADTDAAAAAGEADMAAGDATAEEAAPEMSQPFEPTEITINKFALDAVGAKVDVSGALTVPEGGTLDAPVGKLNARLEGVNGLIDKAVQMGFVPEDQVAGIRMMLAMFTKAAPEGGDALVGEYEFKEGGQVFANGQQVK
ncbi:DUF2125 domain-containing protein [Paracoccus sphaerophysae]|uniref:DUF2125 domain-containing protein n=1 Tax=Paracoccus sphaerophysae TaxID=690417 RepID=A0A099EY22_9RHOB|nr:DUF2125 domain-containing protein [Paracoccus sphaerophysae]KGJ02868.1 hypothetical protein IC63_14050 [Paracoccus sphaerophysae]